MNEIYISKSLPSEEHFAADVTVLCYSSLSKCQSIYLIIYSPDQWSLGLSVNCFPRGCFSNTHFCFLEFSLQYQSILIFWVFTTIINFVIYKFPQFRSSLPLILPKTQLIVSVFIQLSHIVHLSEKNVNKSLVFSYVFRKSWKLIHLKNIKICWKILLVSEFGFSFSFV